MTTLQVSSKLQSRETLYWLDIVNDDKIKKPTTAFVTHGCSGKWFHSPAINRDFKYQVTEQVDLQLQVKNLANTYWEYAWYNTTTSQSMHSPGDGIAFYGAVNVKFDL